MAEIVEEGGESSVMGVGGDWVIQMKEELEVLERSLPEESKRWRAESIYKIPASLKSLQPKAYQPQMASIGPYQHGEVQLKGMEEHKKRALLAFLKRSKKSLESYVDELAPLEQDLKNAYPQLQPHFKKPDRDSHGFLKMMIVDGCFILELIWFAAASKEEVAAAAYASNDPVFSDHGKLYLLPLLQRDMLMLENQLPLLLLLKLDQQEALTKRILKFFKQWDGIRDIREFENCSHILELYRKSMLMSELPKSKPRSKPKICPCLPTDSHSRAKGEETERRQGSRDCRKKVDRLIKSVCGPLKKKKKKEEYIIRSATELSEAGIKLEVSKMSYLDGILFIWRKGVLELPQITVDALTNSLFLNLMAFERLHVEAGNDVTSYVYFMDRLIESDKDVRLLHWRGVIDNLLGSDNDVANLFNSISTDVCLDESSSLSRVQEQVCKYYRKPLPRFMAFAKHNYFANPWITISIFAAISLFCLTITQTVFSALDYSGKK